MKRIALALLLLVSAAPAMARVALREGRHPGYVRLVLDLPRGARALLSPAGLLEAHGADGAPLALDPPGRAAPIGALRNGPGLRLVLPRDARVRAWRLGDRFVFDIGAEPAQPRRAARSLPLPPTPPAPPAPGERVAAARGQWDLPASAFARPGPANASAPAAVAATALTPPHADVALPYASSIPIAAFRRGQKLLIVIAGAAPPSAVWRAAQHATATALPSATLLELPTSLAPAARDGAWHLVAASGAPPIVPGVTSGGVMLPVTAPGPVLSVRDPVRGGLLLVGTARSPGGVASPWRTPFFTLLPSRVGVAVAAQADAVQLSPVAGGFALGGGAVALPLGPYDAAAAATAGARLLDLPALPLATLRRRLTEATLAAAIAPPLARGRARLKVAEAMLALGMGADAQGVLRLAVDADARLAADPRFRLAQTAAEALFPRDGAAIATPSAPCAAADEACLWRAVRLAARPADQARAAAMFASVLPILEAYPAPLRHRLLPLAAETLLAAHQDASARTLLAAFPHARSLRLARVMMQEATLPPPTAGVGGRDAAARALAAVLAGYDRLARSRDRLVAFRAAFRAARLRDRRGLATPAETATALDKLRDAWRGDARALALREALAKARADAGEWSRALALLRRQTRDPQVKQKLASMFARAMAEDATHPMPPLEFVSLVESNPDLLPPGAPGLAILSRLAHRLAVLDLPDQAARVYARMLPLMPADVARAGVGAQLAAQRLAVGDAKGARAALAESAVAGALPPDLLQQRTLLFARATAKLGDLPAATAALAALGTTPALAERAGLLEKAGDWPAATEALRAYAAATVPPSGTLAAAPARTLIRLAAAAGHAGDATLLAALRAHDLTRMPAGHAADLFRMLTDPAAVSASDLPRLAQTWGLPQGIGPALRAAGAELIPTRQ